MTWHIRHHTQLQQKLTICREIKQISRNLKDGNYIAYLPNYKGIRLEKILKQ